MFCDTSVWRCSGPAGWVSAWVWVGAAVGNVYLRERSAKGKDFGLIDSLSRSARLSVCMCVCVCVCLCVKSVPSYMHFL